MKLFFKFLKHIFFIGTIGYLIIFPLLHHVEEINPFQRELSDFRFTDIYFGHFNEKEKDNDILLVDVGFKDNEETRVQITDFINNVNKNFKPKVIAVDVNFKYDKSVSNNVNSNLITALESENIIIYYDLIKMNDKWLKNRSEIPINYKKIREGYTNCLVEKDTFGVLRFFQPYVVQDKDTMKHLSLIISEQFGVSPKKSLEINKKAMINFSYNFNEPIEISDTSNLEVFKDKIIILGLFTKNNIGQPQFNDDIHYTSSNRHYLGKSFPNMYGGEVLATIVSNIKNDSFIEYYKNLSLYINIILSFIIYFILLYSKTLYHEIYGTIEILVKFILVMFFIFISIYFIGQSNIYVDFTLVGVVSFFAVEFVGPIDHLIDMFENKIKKITIFKK